jgi:hypothetical protein
MASVGKSKIFPFKLKAKLSLDITKYHAMMTYPVFN